MERAAGTQDRAIKLAEQAQAALSKAPNEAKSELAEVTAWLAERGAK